MPPGSTKATDNGFTGLRSRTRTTVPFLTGATATGPPGQRHLCSSLSGNRTMASCPSKARTTAKGLTGLRSMVTGSTSLEQGLLVPLKLEPRPSLTGPRHMGSSLGGERIVAPGSIEPRATTSGLIFSKTWLWFLVLGSQNHNYWP